MIPEMLIRRRLRTFLDAMQNKDLETMSRMWTDDICIEFPAGLPMAGTWQGIDEVRSLFKTLFLYNARMRMTLSRVAIEHPWSLTGRCTIFTEWDAVEDRHDGQRVRSHVVSVAETRHWRGCRTVGYFCDVPALAEHYSEIDLPPRTPASPLGAASPGS